MIRRSGTDQKPLASEDEISRGSNNIYLHTRMKICLHVFVFEFPEPPPPSLSLSLTCSAKKGAFNKNL